MLIVPLISLSLIASITSMNDPKSVGRMGLKSFVSYIITTAIAIALGLGIAALIQPGTGITLDLAQQATPVETVTFSLVDTLINLIPINPIAAFAKGEILQIIVFSIFLGLAINIAGEKGTKVAEFMQSGAEVMYSMTQIVMKFAPLGVFALIASTAGTQDSELLWGLLKIILTVYLVCGLHIFFTLGTITLLFAKLNPLVFFKKIFPVQMLAYTTSSSSATLPFTMEVAERDLNVSKKISSFTLPLGTTINMDGTAIYQGVCVMFVAQALNIDLSMGDYITVILTATLASIGTAGVPGAGLIMLSLVLASIGLPLEAVAIIAGIDRILDMMRTVVNVTGDLAIATAINESEKIFDKNMHISNH